MVGFGPGPWEKVTLEVEDLLLNADRIYFRDPTWEVYEHLERQGKRLFRLNHLYMLGLPYGEVYGMTVEILLKSARLYGPLVYAQAGNPFVFEFSTAYLLAEAAREGLTVRVVEGMSCLDTMFVEHQLDPGHGLQILNMFQVLQGQPWTPQIGALIFQVGAPIVGYGSNFLEIMRLEAHLGRLYPPGHPLVLMRPSATSTAQERIPMKLGELSRRSEELTLYSTLYVPARG